MKEVKEFITAFFESEAKTYYSWGFPDIEAFNSNLNEMNSFCIEELHNTFGMVPLLKPEDDDFYEDCKDDACPNLRHFFKIAQYKHSTYDSVFLVYCSGQNPDMDYLTYFNCFFVAKIDGKLKIIKKYDFSDDRDYLPPDNWYWNELQGDKSINMNQLGELVAIERCKEPSDCKYSMKEYLSDAPNVVKARSWRD